LAIIVSLCRDFKQSAAARQLSRDLTRAEPGRLERIWPWRKIDRVRPFFVRDRGRLEIG